MEYVPVNLAHGSLPTPLGILFSVPDQVSMMMRSVILVNTTASEVFVTLQIRIGLTGTPRNMIPPNMRLGPYSKFDDNSVITLDAESAVLGACDVSNAVDYIISGVQAV